MKILYCGDDEFACVYVLGALNYLGHNARNVLASGQFPGFEDGDDVLILSDYPARSLSGEQAEEIVMFVNGGGKLVMLGGWASFNGFGNNYYGTPVGEILPVKLQQADDRRNVGQGLIIRRRKDFQDVESLPWGKPPVICGYNAATAKTGADVLLEMLPVETDGTHIALGAPLALAVKGAHGNGQVVACLTDLAPHWCGGLVDWGENRVMLPTGKDVGSSYPGFLEMLLTA